ncbi:MAG: sensor histidine kinase [Chloroflexi bacterium]|nr:sensor histidine kinase [Chloroflexota bacterium]
MSVISPAQPRQEQPLSQRVFALQQVIPLLILAVVMFYEITSHLIFETDTHPLLFAMETLIFGMAGPAFTWITLNWVAREIAKRERAEGEADALNAMMQEMHHRIKNNLQTVADLLSLEMSRNPRPEVLESLRDSITRIKTIAASHQMLSVESVGATDITELARLVGEQARRSMVRPDQKILLRVEGPSIFLTSKQATAFALVLNELICNAMEHGFRDRKEGKLNIELDWDEDEILLRVRDDGDGLPDGFDLTMSKGLGLQIARTLVEKDLRGRMGIAKGEGDDKSTTAWVRIQRNGAIEK